MRNLKITGFPLLIVNPVFYLIFSSSIQNNKSFEKSNRHRTLQIRGIFFYFRFSYLFLCMMIYITQYYRSQILLNYKFIALVILIFYPQELLFSSSNLVNTSRCLYSSSFCFADSFFILNSHE